MSEKNSTHDDLFDRLRAAADAVPPSTLDLPVVLIGSRRKARARRAATGVTAVTAVALLGVGVASGVPGQVARDLAPAAAYETVSTETVHAEAAPGITVVTQAAAYELPDETVVLDTGLETGAHGDRFLIVSTVEVRAGGVPAETPHPGERPGDTVSVDPASGLIIDPESGQLIDPRTGVLIDPTRDPADPAYIQEMADLGYAPFKIERVQVVVGDDAELARIRGGGEPATVVVSELGSTALVDTDDGRFVFGAVEQWEGDVLEDARVVSWAPFEKADGSSATELIVPLLGVPDRSTSPFAVKVQESAGFDPRMEVTFADGDAAAGRCTLAISGCAVTYDASTRAAVQSQEADPRWEAYLASTPSETITVKDPEGSQTLYWCETHADSASGGFANGLSERQEDVVIEATAGLSRCKVERTQEIDGGLRIGS